jgi:predicted short-subunit dehydrogenase-like oxidoreductase (DUF2520 family)
MKALKVFVYGAGRVGRSLGLAIEQDGAQPLQLCGAWNRSFSRALETSGLLDVEVSAGDAVPEAFTRADVIIMSVPDDAVVSTANALARHLGHKQILLHTSGSLACGVMASPLMKAKLGCVHPLQALARPGGDPGRLRGSTFAIEGEGSALEAARAVALAAGGTPVEIPSGAKVCYHAAAVVSANFITVLVDMAAELLSEAGVDASTGIEMLMPLLEGTLGNISELNRSLSAEGAEGAGLKALSQALTGPVRRGDVGTVKKHLKGIKRLAAKEPRAADLPDLYRLLAARATAISARGDLDEASAQALLAALSIKKKREP